MTTEEIAEAVAARIAEIADLSDPIDRTHATSDLLSVLDRARDELGHAYAGPR